MKLSEAIDYADRATGKASEPLRLLAAAARESIRLKERADVACFDAGEAEHRVRRVENKLRRTMKDGPFVFVPETKGAYPHIEDCAGECIRSFSTGEDEYAKETCDMLNAAVGVWAARILGVKP